jgi:hypothetical protein
VLRLESDLSKDNKFYKTIHFWTELYHHKDPISLGEIKLHLGLLKELYQGIVSKWNETILKMENETVNPHLKFQHQQTISFARSQVRFYENVWNKIAEIFAGTYSDEEQENEIIEYNAERYGRDLKELPNNPQGLLGM